MVAKLIDLRRENRRRITLFKEKCAKLAASRKQFHKHFLINQDHIVIRGAQQNSSLRSAIEPQHIAAVIIHGRINYETSNDDHPIEVAIDGAFKNFRYVEFSTTQVSAEICIPRLQIRVVLREGRVKVLVVTVHSMQEAIDETLPEVNYEIW